MTRLPLPLAADSSNGVQNVLDLPPLDVDAPVAVPHVVAWNLTRRCNLTCAHCYISAGSWHAEATELPTEECHRILNQVLDVNANPMLIFTGGEPLLRDDLEELAEHAASRGATVVVGTNGTRLSESRIESLKAAGVKGVAVSVDSLDAAYHDRFRHGTSALADTLTAVDRLGTQELDFVVQTTVTKGNKDQLRQMVAWAADAGAVSFNLYFIVSTGRGEGMPGLSPHENEAVLEELVQLERKIISGKEVVEHRPKRHDDVAQAVAAVYWQLKIRGGMMVGAPMPEEPYCSFPEFALQKANSSAGVLGGSLGLTTITTSLVAIRLIGAKSFTGS